MEEQTSIAVREFELPKLNEAQESLTAIGEFQRLVRSQLKEGHDFGTIPGTQKPTLLKPGAEKIVKLLKLADTYEFVDTTDDWDRPLFAYVVRASLLHIHTGELIAQGLGECNSMEARYRYRWVFASELQDMGWTQEQRHQLMQRTRNGRNGQYVQYRMENDDIFSLRNTIIKMAKKRALVDAALSVGRLSDLFTQDMEDIGPQQPSEPPSEAPSNPRGRRLPSQPTDGEALSPERTFNDKGELMAAAQMVLGYGVSTVCNLLDVDTVAEIPDAEDGFNGVWRTLLADRQAQE